MWFQYPLLFDVSILELVMKFSSSLLSGSLLAGVLAKTDVIAALSKVIDLNTDSWTLTSQNGSIVVPATIPGQVHLDLFRAEKIQDPYWRNGDIDLRWVTYQNWTYEKTISGL